MPIDFDSVMKEAKGKPALCSSCLTYKQSGCPFDEVHPYACIMFIPDNSTGTVSIIPTRMPSKGTPVIGKSIWNRIANVIIPLEVR